MQESVTQSVLVGPLHALAITAPALLIGNAHRATVYRLGGDGLVLAGNLAHHGADHRH